jgi:hypothetical protein
MFCRLFLIVAHGVDFKGLQHKNDGNGTIIEYQQDTREQHKEMATILQICILFKYIS